MRKTASRYGRLLTLLLKILEYDGMKLFDDETFGAFVRLFACLMAALS